jgi:membrane associated rhomboid family serine protease
MRRGFPLDALLTFGGRAPPAVGGLIAALLLASLAGRLTGLGGLAVLVPALVLEGQAWRLVTWPFVDGDPVSLLFGALTLYWFGRDLAWAWGPRRLVTTWIVLGAASGAVPVLLALLFPGLGGAVFAGPWAVLSGLLVAWGLLNPERQILLMLALPVSGRALVWLTLAGTAFFAAFGEVRAYLPHLAAEAAMLLWARGFSPRGAWQSLRIRLGQWRMRRRARKLRLVRKDGKGEPPRWLN